jgi:hypothetical protein
MFVGKTKCKKLPKQNKKLCRSGFQAKLKKKGGLRFQSIFFLEFTFVNCHQTDKKLPETNRPRDEPSGDEPFGDEPYGDESS